MEEVAAYAEIEKHLPGKHDQADHGRKKGGRLSIALKRHGGFSYNPITRQSAKTGYMVSIYPEHEQVCDDKDFGPDTINAYIKSKEKLFRNGNNYLGGWYDADAEKVYLDISINVQDESEADLLAKEKGQEGYYDLISGKTIIVKTEDERRK